MTYINTLFMELLGYLSCASIL